MSSPAKPTRPTPFDSATERGITAYLAEVDQWVARHLPESEARKVIGEIEQRLEDAVVARLSTGSPPATALSGAIQSVGTAEANATAALEVWFRSGSDSWLSRRVGKANVIAFAVFGIAQLLCIATLHSRIYAPEAVWSENPPPPETPFLDWVAGSFPLPAPHLWHPLGLLPAVIGPLLAGVLAGWLIPVNPHRYVYQVLLPLILYSFLSGVAILPVTDGLVFAILQVVYWLPSGCLVAVATANVTRRFQRRIREEIQMENENR